MHEVDELCQTDRDQLQHGLAHVETGLASWVLTTDRHGDYSPTRGAFPCGSHSGRLCRVSSSETTDNLERQAERVVSWWNAKGWSVGKVVKECGSGINEQRPKFGALLADPKIGQIVVEHKDRASRFGVAYLQTLLSMQGRELVLVNTAD